LAHFLTNWRNATTLKEMMMDVVFGFKLSTDFVKMLLDAWRFAYRRAADLSLLTMLWQHVPRVWTA
jgi:hypothetical protein